MEKVCILLPIDMVEGTLMFRKARIKYHTQKKQFILYKAYHVMNKFNSFIKHTCS